MDARCWPFSEPPGFVAGLLAGAHSEFNGDMLAAVRNVFIERGVPFAQYAMPRETLQAIMFAYGHLWHVNNEPAAPTPLYLPEKASYAARRHLRDLLTTEQRVEAINQVGVLLGRYDVQSAPDEAHPTPQEPTAQASPAVPDGFAPVGEA
jgi:hypothetical protein